MPSRFPGMDPYVEGQVWKEFHNNFISEIQAALVPRLRPRYVVRLEERVYVEREPNGTSHYIIPDVTLVEDTAPLTLTGGGSTATVAQPVAIPVVMPEEVRELYLEVRLRETHEVVTVIEVLSPDNKRTGSDGRREYLAKREIVLKSPAHLIEIDLLRGGTRLPMARPLPPADYYVFVHRSQRRPMADVWHFTLRDPMPTIPVPLAGNDPDVSLDLQAVFNAVYDRAGYDYSLDYQHGTVPPLSEEEAAWAQGLLTISSTSDESPRRPRS
ncbi:MAG: DUF4058 family protein [Abditibacteriales bacterium]|nr:DUF4058 family protein [Abditibacteriales bacterium]MDW8368030.1 DUF4058 family protein [Abditibacteriales bacterium]